MKKISVPNFELGTTIWFWTASSNFTSEYLLIRRVWFLCILLCLCLPDVFLTVTISPLLVFLWLPFLLCTALCTCCLEMSTSCAVSCLHFQCNLICIKYKWHSKFWTCFAEAISVYYPFLPSFLLSLLNVWSNNIWKYQKN